jgi:hypothetical protein
VRLHDQKSVTFHFANDGQHQLRVLGHDAEGDFRIEARPATTVPPIEPLATGGVDLVGPTKPLGEAAKAVDPRGVWIRGAHVVEPLDVSFCTVPHPLRFELSTFEAPVKLIGAQFPRIWLAGCTLDGLQADGARIENDLRLISSRIYGEARLAHAKIGTQLACSGAKLAGENDVALM